MTTETRSSIAEQARVYVLFGFMGAIGCWIGFAHQLHVELRQDFGDSEFGWPLVLWMLGGVLSTVLLTASGFMVALHQYFEASVAPSETTAAGEPAG
jgi:hypothetical protein